MNDAVLNSGYTQNVCGLSWLNIYLESVTVVMFGDGKLFNSLKSVNIPAKIGHENIKILTDVINSELPLLLNKKEMKMAKAKIYFDNIINIFGPDIKILLTANGHFIPISRTNQAIVDIA